ncbi:hypothetical protein B9T33_07225 [Acinetobacter sp. ANC 5054]|uniref:DUF2167 domain-containing protein n=1 Tax=Acinetobacter sp. ANC 5054 TaxID=1977877 RepID=UPI000A3377F5|nr:DUF2167 domain-containing protein [Acinetobacter sp. ANC 5054]OTG81448.1 hypothetical protein B9T33_07225 [Acinetobacter sp. ANC 5054]
MPKKTTPFQLKSLCQSIALSLALASSVIIPQSTMASETAAQSEQASPMAQLNWHMGPQSERIADVATLKTKSEQGYLDTADSDRFLEMTGNLPSGQTNILVAQDDSWWATFDYESSGYIKDDEKIDADALLKELKASDEPSNEERTRLGMSKLYTVGWAVPPHYDAQTKQLEWALKVRSEENHETINYTVRLLGRSGVMSATLVSDETDLNKNIAQFKDSLTGFDFQPGQRYSEFRAGDKVAEYGLAALITGGGIAVAAKKGLFAALIAFLVKGWKLVLIGCAAAAGGLGSIFKRKKNTEQ